MEKGEAPRTGKRAAAVHSFAPSIRSPEAAAGSMSKVILDTDVLIDLLRGYAPTRDFLQERISHSIPCCSVISVAEIHAGMRPEEEAVTRDLLDGLNIIPLTRQIAEVAGHFKGRTRNQRLELADCLIAATALLEGAALATGNVKDYPMPEISVMKARK